tara:strand:- start:414 stop:1145 length:732 start_codon:yes stop_codon:yes gene_type:complete
MTTQLRLKNPEDTHKFGGNIIGTAYTGLGYDLTPDTTFVQPTVAVALRIKAGGNIADDYTAGTGARKVLLDGLDENFERVTEEIFTNGVDVSAASTATFVRLNRAYVTDCGTYGGANTAAINIETTAGALQAVLRAGEGQTQRAHFTIPAGFYGILEHMLLTPDSQKVTSFRVMTREDADDVTTPFKSKTVLSEFTNLAQPVEWNPQHGVVLKPNTDVWIEAKVIASTGIATANFEIHLERRP